MRVPIHTETHIPIRTQRSQHRVRHRLTTRKVQIRRIRNRRRRRRTRKHRHEPVPGLITTIDHRHVHRHRTNTRRRQTRRRTLIRQRTRNLHPTNRHTRRRTKTPTRGPRINNPLRRIQRNNLETRVARRHRDWRAISDTRCGSERRNRVRPSWRSIRHRNLNRYHALGIRLNRIQHLRVRLQGNDHPLKRLEAGRGHDERFTHSRSGVRNRQSGGKRRQHTHLRGRQRATRDGPRSCASTNDIYRGHREVVSRSIRQT